MKNGHTNRLAAAVNTHSLRDPDHVSIFIVLAVALLGVFIVGANIAFTGQSGLDTRYTALLVSSSILLIGTCAAQHKDKSPLLQRETTPCFNDEIAHQISWSALRPYASGESRNCKISQRSTTRRLLFSPILSFQYTALILAASVLTCLVTSSLTASLPQILKRGVAATSDPVFTTFICLFSVAVMGCVAWLLRKPVRSLEFNKDLGVFWIEKYRVFGWKVGESAQMPISQIHALQLISYSKRNTNHQEPYLAETAPDCQQQKHNNQLVTDYEVNVVFRNAERVNIISHCNCGAIKHDIGILASFLDVPIWDKPPPINPPNT